MKPITPASPHAIIMVGVPGSGKSTFAERFAETFKAPILNQARIADDANLNEDQSEVVFKTILKEYLKTDRTFVIESSHLTRVKRNQISSTVSKAGFRPMIIWVQTEPLEAKRRSLKAKPAGKGMSEQQFDAAFNSFQPPLAIEKATVISGRHTYATQVKVVLKKLAGSRPETKVTAPSPRQPGKITVR
jgi:predicted kinase